MVNLIFINIFAFHINNLTEEAFLSKELYICKTRLNFGNYLNFKIDLTLGISSLFRYIRSVLINGEKKRFWL